MRCASTGCASGSVSPRAASTGTSPICAAYRTALVEAWGSLQDRTASGSRTFADIEPRERLGIMMQAVMRPAAVGARACHARVGDDRRCRRGEACGEATAGCCGRCSRRSSTPDSTRTRPRCDRSVFFGAGMGVLHGSTIRSDAPVDGARALPRFHAPALARLVPDRSCASRYCSRSWAATSMSLCRHSDAR